MPEVKIAAKARDEFGKGAARRSRREGRVPAVRPVTSPCPGMT